MDYLKDQLKGLGLDDKAIEIIVKNQGSVMNKINNYGNQCFGIIWSIEDIKQRDIDNIEEGSDSESPLTLEEIEEVRSRLNKHSDCNYGITWETIDYVIEQVKDDRYNFIVSFFWEKFGIKPNDVERKYLYNFFLSAPEENMNTIDKYFADMLEDCVIDLKKGLVSYDNYRIDLNIGKDGYYNLYRFVVGSEEWALYEGYTMLIDAFLQNPVNNRTNNEKRS